MLLGCCFLVTSFWEGPGLEFRRYLFLSSDVLCFGRIKRHLEMFSVLSRFLFKG